MYFCSHLSKASTSQREKEKDWRRWQARMQYGIRLLERAIEKVGEHFSVVAWKQQPQCVGRARSQAVPLKAHHLTSPPHAIVRRGERKKNGTISTMNGQ